MVAHDPALSSVLNTSSDLRAQKIDQGGGCGCPLLRFAMAL